MQFSASIVTAPVIGSLLYANAGHFLMHGGSTQWLHAKEWWNVGTPGRCLGLNV
jgi:hypothetical protein